MLPILSRDQMRELDRRAIEELGVPSLILMENAGRGAAEAIAAELAPGARIVVACGSGNNGGDGYVVARRLAARGFQPRVVSSVPVASLKGDARSNHAAWTGVGGAVTELGGDLAPLEAALDDAEAAVDALFGTGLGRPIEGLARELIERLNQAALERFALDVPSGIDCDTGAVLGAAVRARTTITFAHMKLGLFGTPGAELAGSVRVADIGIPDALWRQVGASAELVETSDVSARLAPRRLGAHKGSSGRVLVLAGSAGKIGAALLVGRGALRTGAGLVTLGGLPATADALDRHVLELMTGRLDPTRLRASLDELLAGKDAAVVGPGLGLDETARTIVEHVAFGWRGPAVLDADALTLLGGRLADLRGAAGPRVLTPHPGEMARLLATDADAVERDRFGAVRSAVEQCGQAVLLKGPRTLIGAPGTLTTVNASGTPALATGGSGDVLAGMIGACLVSLDARWSAIAAAHLHGLCAERWSESTRADRGLLAGEIADLVPGAIAALLVPQP